MASTGSSGEKGLNLSPYKARSLWFMTRPPRGLAGKQVGRRWRRNRPAVGSSMLAVPWAARARDRVRLGSACAVVQWRGIDLGVVASVVLLFRPGLGGQVQIIQREVSLAFEHGH